MIQSSPPFDSAYNHTLNIRALTYGAENETGFNRARELPQLGDRRPTHCMDGTASAPGSSPTKFLVLPKIRSFFLGKPTVIRLWIPLDKSPNDSKVMIVLLLHKLGNQQTKMSLDWGEGTRRRQRIDLLGALLKKSVGKVVLAAEARSLK
ncbi:uncharacterized protein FOMMEDRAFT_156099 [Fomitiporia mediterranea MF3/22]|uniref:uncharacterized protein n=1 Tax=Fomitiporia mediterranea (strain MF3/22) TaxID=694068 RepID=UPI0004408704|nr:uncharacterized protein FOMMEDRAFT_156099 [Fomitiporia mediterranea MF3/22]EJD02764.1 hypothetical protein FOMMEDRAFT_156099 [Fomitiporia mediterranea MF3/22]